MPMHHIVAMLPPAWGHTVSYLHLVLQMLRADPTLVVTIYQHEIIVPQIEKELVNVEYESARLAICAVGTKNVQFGPTMFEVVFAELISNWMGALEKITKEGQKWPKPSAIHILLLYPAAGLSIKATMTEYDYAQSCEEIYADEGRRAGRTRDEIGVALATCWNDTGVCTGAIVSHPGLEDMYDYERSSLAAGPPVANWPFFCSGQKVAKVAHGVVIFSSPTFEPVGIPELRSYFAKRGQELFACGMQTHEACFARTPGGPVVVNDERVRSFLESSQEKYGANSTLFISFGSLFFPVEQIAHVEALINTLISLPTPFPFIFALAGSMAVDALPQALIDRVNASGKGLICQSWVEQRAIIQHPATGWFLSHGGFNSVTESLVEGVPMIIWPAGAEQPLNAALCASGPRPVAFELLQIRMGAQAGPSLRHPEVEITGSVEDAVKEFEVVLTQARGESGERLRRNAQEMGQSLRKARAGEALEEVKRLAVF
ncbi:hypothetical protein MKEN_00536500 [Mycena kentingensis (nom. inval.)]|nr:hypothetical protein MKEN_00536500 [Mycena kentingensis (nom. inval.)]